jgi:hypothetical protein
VRRRFAVLAAVTALLGAGAAAASGHGNGIGGELGFARAGTAPFHSVEVAKAAGYGILRDAKGIACIDNPGAGGMGIHYVNATLVGDDKVFPAAPELIVYEPTRHGLEMVAAEYVVFQDKWDATHSSPPELFGQEFELVGEGNRYGLPPFYELHAWLWKHNPRGFFDDWNPRVHCPAS